MAGEDQEQFEDYLELEYYIETLQLGRAAHPPSELTPSKARIYRLAALFRSTASEAGRPHPEFAAALQARLEQELGQSGPPRKKRSHVSRRALLTGGAVAASLVVGAGLSTGLSTGIEHATQLPATTTNPWPTLLLPEGEGSWMAVAKLAELGDEALPFRTESIVGYLIHSDGDQGEEPGVIAISAACSHMGCIVQWQKADRKYHCPCHGGLFSEYGKPDKASPLGYLTALPRLETRIKKQGTAEFIEVRVPTSTKTT